MEEDIYAMNVSVQKRFVGYEGYEGDGTRNWKFGREGLDCGTVRHNSLRAIQGRFPPLTQGSETGSDIAVIWPSFQFPPVWPH